MYLKHRFSLFLIDIYDTTFENSKTNTELYIRFVNIFNQMIIITNTPS
jgi:hypothetical protein